MIRRSRPLMLGLAALGLGAGGASIALPVVRQIVPPAALSVGTPITAPQERGYWADRPLARPLGHPSRFTPADAARLRPGQYRWAPYAGEDSPVRVVIDLASQRAFVFQGSALVGIAAVSTGRRGHGTPAGSYPILEKARWHRSNTYSNAPMPYMQRLTWGGIALHAGHDPGRPASHGCIRLPYGFARALFAATRIGGSVLVTRGAPLSVPDEPAPQPMVEMVSAAPAQAPAPVRKAGLMSTARAVAYVAATML